MKRVNEHTEKNIANILNSKKTSIKPNHLFIAKAIHLIY